MRIRILLTVILIAVLSVDSMAWILAIKGGRIITMADGIIEDGMIIVENDRIIDVGKDLAIPEGAAVIDASGKVITPGLFDAYTHIGLIEISQVRATVE